MRSFRQLCDRYMSHLWLDTYTIWFDVSLPSLSCIGKTPMSPRDFLVTPTILCLVGMTSFSSMPIILSMPMPAVVVWHPESATAMISVSGELGSLMSVELVARKASVSRRRAVIVTLGEGAGVDLIKRLLSLFHSICDRPRDPEGTDSRSAMSDCFFSGKPKIQDLRGSITR